MTNLFKENINEEYCVTKGSEIKGKHRIKKQKKNHKDKHRITRKKERRKGRKQKLRDRDKCKWKFYIVHLFGRVPLGKTLYLKKWGLNKNKENNNDIASFFELDLKTKSGSKQ